MVPIHLGIQISHNKNKEMSFKYYTISCCQISFVFSAHFINLYFIEFPCCRLPFRIVLQRLWIMGNAVRNLIGVSTGHVFFYSRILQPWNYFSVPGMNFSINLLDARNMIFFKNYQCQVDKNFNFSFTFWFPGRL